MIVERSDVEVAVALAALVAPLLFVASVGLGLWQRNRRGRVGAGLEALVSLLGGASLGLFILASSGILLLDMVFFVSLTLLAYARWHQRKRRQAGLLVAGFALPWTVLWGFYVVATLLGMTFEPAATWAGFLGGLLVVVLGGVVAALGDPPAPPPDPMAAPGEPGSRKLGTIGVAIMGPTTVGPFRIPDIAAMAALVGSLIVADLAIRIPFVGLAAGIVLGAVLATEAYVRATPTRSRRAFEAFSWLGDWELERVVALTGLKAPATPKAAEQWLAKVPDSEITRFARAEVLVLAGRLDEAQAAADTLPTATPWQRLERASTLELIDWVRGGDGNLDAVEAALAAISPADSNEHLRGEVVLATARVRQAMSAGLPAEGDRLEPFLEVRERLGARADGQVSRALRKRLIPTFLLMGALFGSLGYLIGWIFELAA